VCVCACACARMRACVVFPVCMLACNKMRSCACECARVYACGRKHDGQVCCIVPSLHMSDTDVDSIMQVISLFQTEVHDLDPLDQGLPWLSCLVLPTDAPVKAMNNAEFGFESTLNTF